MFQEIVVVSAPPQPHDFVAKNREKEERKPSKSRP
jgi:hypothetical protein